MNDQITQGILVGSALVLTASSAVRADQDYPNRPIRWIAPYSPGGSTSWTSRLVGEHLTAVWGQQVLIDNRPGANTVKEFVALAKRPPGELMFASSSHGGSANLAPRLFNMVAKTETTQVPYQGAGNAMIDVIGGQVQYFRMSGSGLAFLH